MGDSGTIVTSADGATWTVRTSGASINLTGAVYGGGTFVAVGQWGTILQSGIIVNPPAVTTFTASAITVTGAALNGNVNPNGLNTTYYFEYGATTTYGTATDTVNGGSGSSDVAVSANLTGLTAGAVYHYRLVATNSAGTTRGLDQTFTTSAIGSISGRVAVNFAGQNDINVANATVSLQGTSYSTTTESNGNFTLANVPFGNYNLIISAPNLNTQTQVVTLSGQSLQVTVPSMTVPRAGDVTDDNHVGLEDIIYLLQVMSGIR